MENKAKKNFGKFSNSGANLSEKHWTIGIVGFIIYSVLVSLRTEAIFWGKREFGKEKTEVML